MGKAQEVKVFFRRRKSKVKEKKSAPLVVQTDGAMLADGSGTGLGVVVKDISGQIVRWVHQRAPAMTNNEAEYAALCLALEVLAKSGAQTVHVYSDSKVMVMQMRGRYQVHSPDLRRWHERACQLARLLPKVTYTHIPRERNQLADALANEALQGALPEPSAW